MIAISATDRKLTASMDLRFGRCPYFLLTDGEVTRFIPNPYQEEENDVAPRVVELLKNQKVTKIVTGEIGPKAKTSLDQNKIQVIMLSEDKISLQHVLKKMNLSR
ncbi:NifB/NifX family molybdenum-iron cluster-binding protein [Gaoshiqia sediminis]|uniref:NifB/NifX family molybdenum-iron cluster-binding protein n=1 Tax=Gaoshiqia sediminis TaxID=2986998 RepID=A0AA42C572_9BACT|nr:NifB/NifX family molybdenum-iron cluster-binding protein [Gaoshiqia sediminis]MCW0482508.1 NifB/NifX family molybdenum-iron cluster-binding protein [Gaoshiqia sediminis]